MQEREPHKYLKTCPTLSLDSPPLSPHPPPDTKPALGPGFVSLHPRPVIQDPALGPYLDTSPGAPSAQGPSGTTFSFPFPLSLTFAYLQAPGVPPDSPSSGFTSSSALPRPRTFQVCPTPSRGPPPKALGLLPLLLIPHSAPQPQRFPRAGPPQCDMSIHPDRPLWTPSPLYPRLPAPLPRPAWGAAPRLPDPLPGSSAQEASRRRAGQGEGSMRKQGTLDLQANLPGGFRTRRKRDGAGTGRGYLEAGPCRPGPEGRWGGGVPSSKVSLLDPERARSQGHADSAPGTLELGLCGGDTWSQKSFWAVNPIVS